MDFKTLIPFFFAFCFFLPASSLVSQVGLDYYLPDDDRRTEIPSPEAIIGFQVGEWHVSHDRLDNYFKALAEASPMAQYVEYGRSHEQRPLSYLIITNEKNQANIDKIKAQHAALKQEGSEDMDLENLPAILYQGYGVHGNEQSGTEAAMLVAYHLLSSTSDYITELLDKTVILLDPCFNPDGLQRFSSWVNANRFTHLNPDENSREFWETWPGGRTNHYWFDLNRDWLFTIHPSSKGRIKNFHEWHPTILTDHHEMGKNSTFFFQPGVPSRTNPMTPQLNQDLTEEIGTFHARALDSLGSEYFTKERFDDYYYGKGSTYPDINGCIGILFEQASARGHLQESKNGLLSYPFTIRNQVAVSFSTHKALLYKREELLSYTRDFFNQSRAMAARDSIKAYSFSHANNFISTYFAETLRRHDIEVTEIAPILSNEKRYAVSCKQDQYRLIKTIFEPVSSFPDSIFYDVSTWSFPLSLNLSLERHTALPEMKAFKMQERTLDHSQANILWVDADIYQLPGFLHDMAQQDLSVSLLTADYALSDQVTLSKGSIYLTSKDDNWVKAKAAMDSISTSRNVMLRSAMVSKSDLKKLDKTKQTITEIPKVGMLTGRGLDGYQAGYIWHQFDIHWNVPISHLDIDRLKFIDLSKYQTIIIPNLSDAASTEHFQKIKEWVNEGGHLIIVRSNLDIFDALGFFTAQRVDNEVLVSLQNEADAGTARSAQVIGGAIFDSFFDLDHPFTYGYDDPTLPVFQQGNIFYDTAELQEVGSYGSLLSGYASKENQRILNGRPVVRSGVFEKGRISHFAVNPCFRGYFMGTNRLFANAIYLNSLAN